MKVISPIPSLKYTKSKQINNSCGVFNAFVDASSSKLFLLHDIASSLYEGNPHMKVLWRKTHCNPLNSKCFAASRHAERRQLIVLNPRKKKILHWNTRETIIRCIKTKKICKGENFTVVSKCKKIIQQCCQKSRRLQQVTEMSYFIKSCWISGRGTASA